MPELAEVEFFRKRWNPGLGMSAKQVLAHPRARVFRNCGRDIGDFVRVLTGAVLEHSEAKGKQMLFRFRTAGGDAAYVGIHLGMTGELRTQTIPEAGHFKPAASEHFVLVQAECALVFADPRMFGRIRLATGDTPPSWWTALPPEIMSPAFTEAAMATFLQRRARAPIKAVLLMQERFPGIGNWMADEILWRAGIHPRQLAGDLARAELHRLWNETRWVCEQALATIGETYADPPPTWLFPHRWKDGGTCPRTGAALVREPIGGRTTCWSPGRQHLRTTKLS